MDEIGGLKPLPIEEILRRKVRYGKGIFSQHYKFIAFTLNSRADNFIKPDELIKFFGLSRTRAIEILEDLKNLDLLFKKDRDAYGGVKNGSELLLMKYIDLIK